MKEPDFIFHRDTLEQLCTQGGFTMILPVTYGVCPIGGFVHCAVLHAEYMDQLEAGEPPAEITENMIEFQQFFVLDHRKDCRWERVSNREWGLNLGPNCVRDWAKMFKPVDAENQPSAEFYVSVNYLVPTRNNLREFNKRWGKVYWEQSR